ncbi:MAG: hypothetical protein JTJ26_09160 [Prevotella sp.]|nr:hypothetical protein [Prevotella sp.]
MSKKKIRNKMPKCTQCSASLNFVGNEEYGDNGYKYLYHCPNCGADLEVFEPLEEENPNIHFGNDKGKFFKPGPYLSCSKQMFEITVSAKLDSTLSEGYRR